MNRVQIKEKYFRPYISQEQIALAVKSLAKRIYADIEGKNPLFVILLNGAFVFASDLLREIDMPVEIDFMRVKSYSGTQSTGKINLIQDIQTDITNRLVILIEDIVDTGTTMNYLLQELRARNPRNIKIATLLFKPDSLQYDFKVDYAAFEIPSDFIVGYGLDYDNWGRNLREIYVIDNP